MAAVLQDPVGERDGVVEPVALARHDRGRERLREVEHDVAVGRRRQHEMRRSGIGDQAGRHAVVRLQEVGDLLARAVEPGRREVGRRHRRRDPEHDHHRPLGVGEGRRLALPAGPATASAPTIQPASSRSCGAMRQRDGPPTISSLQQVGIDHARPAAGRVGGAAAREPQQDRRHDQRQRPGAQEVEGVDSASIMCLPARSAGGGAVIRDGGV